MIQSHSIWIYLLKLYFIKDIPTLYPVDPFNPSQDASTLRNSFNGLGTDEQAAINVLCKRVAAQRDTIDATYNTMYSKVETEKLFTYF